MAEIDRAIAETAEYGLVDAIVAAAAQRRSPDVCVVADDETLAAIGAAFTEAAERLDVPGVRVLAIGEASQFNRGILVVASMRGESALVSELAAAAEDGVTVLGLWRDLLVHKIADLFPKTRPGPKRLFAAPREFSDAQLAAVRPYAIVCTPRTGSTLLADLLMQLNCAGEPREHLRPGPMRLAELGDFDFARLMRAVMVAGASANGIFGTKVISQFLDRAERLVDDGVIDLSAFRALPLRVVRLRRRDLAAQALSNHLAIESKVFFERNADKTAQRNAYLAGYEYAFEPLAAAFSTLADQEAALDATVARSGAPVLDVYYEDLVGTPTDELTRVLGFIGVDEPTKYRTPAATVAKLDDSKTAAIYERFRRDAVAAGLKVEHGPESPRSEVEAGGDASSTRSAIPSLAKTRALAEKINPGAQMGPYQAVDIEVVDYRYTRIDGLPRRWRGPVPDDLESPGSFFAALGAAQTLGRFCRDPYVAQIERETGVPGLNLGFSGAGPTFFLDQPEILEVVNRSKFAIVQVMSGRSVGNSLMRCEDGRNIVTWLPTGERCFAEEAYQRLLDEYPKRDARRVVQEAREAWIEHMGELLDRIEVPTVLTWFSTRPPRYRPRFDGRLGTLMGAFPHLVDHKSMKRLTGRADHYVQSVSDRGVPHRLTGLTTGQPVSVVFPNGESRNEDSSYPSPEMHDDLTKALLPVVQALL